jgi:hypothetical protein
MKTPRRLFRVPATQQQILDSKIFIGADSRAAAKRRHGKSLAEEMRWFFSCHALKSLMSNRAFAKAKFPGVTSHFFVSNFRACRPGTTWCLRIFRVFYCQPFKGKPGASRGRKASGL